jgi:hypothetical protein
MSIGLLQRHVNDWTSEKMNEKLSDLTGRELNDWMQAWISDGTGDRTTE